MWPRALLLLLLLGTVRLASGAEAAPPAARRSHRSENFVVCAASNKLARQLAADAEKHRKGLALLWLGKELPPWPNPCAIWIARAEAPWKGWGEFTFYDCKLHSLELYFHGPGTDLVPGLLAHEMTHAVLATHFRQPVPRWADEGAAMLSEGADERQRWRNVMTTVLDAPRRLIRLRRLFKLSHGARDADAFFAQSHAVAGFLVEAKGRSTFLTFVAAGMKDGWDKAVLAHYGYKNVDDLERRWLRHERERRRHERRLGQGRPSRHE
jgi:hypothetical protein